MMHVDYDVVSCVLSEIDAEYGNIANMTTTQGNIHKYLGMTINYPSPGKAKFSIVDFVCDILRNVGVDWRSVY